jgi:hypothetical protein
VDSEKAERQVDYPCCAEMKKDITHLLGQINDLSKRIDFHAVNNSTICEPDEISLSQLIGVVDQRCARIEQSLGGMTEEATFEKIDRLEAMEVRMRNYRKAICELSRLLPDGAAIHLITEQIIRESQREDI